jgi:hypothetical protein
MTNSSTKRLTTLILWAIAWAVAMIASAILLKGNPAKDWIQAALVESAKSLPAKGPEGGSLKSKTQRRIRDSRLTDCAHR